MNAPASVSDIVLASDLSARCDRACERACRLAEAWGARLHILTVIEAHPETPSWVRGDHARRRAQDDFADVIGDRAIAWDVEVIEGSPEIAAPQWSARFRDALVVTGMARNELLGRETPGPTVEALMRSGAHPVLVVKRRAAGPYRRILVPTDFSAAGETVLARVAVMFPDAELTLLHGYRVPFGAFLDEATNWPEFREAALDAQQAFLAKLAAQGVATAKFKTLIELGDPAELVADYTRTENPDLMVMGAQEAALLGKLLGSQLAGRLLMAADCDVLVFPEAAVA